MGIFDPTERITEEMVRGLDRAIESEGRPPGRVARLGTKRMLDRLCRERPETVRETVEELARMRAGWQRISYRRALRQVVRACLSHGPSIDSPPGI